MKRMILGSLIMSGLAALLVICSPGTARGDTFELRIPRRAPALPIVRVTVELRVIGAGAAGGGTLTVSHGAIVNQNIPLDGLPHTVGVSNSITAALGGDRVVIHVLPNENLVSPTALCSERAGMPDPDVWTFTYTGNGATVASGHRINSYTAPSGAECLACRSERLGSDGGNRASIAAASPPLPNLGRIAIDFMFVLDNSWSMSSNVPVTGMQKMAVLRDAVAQSIGLLQSEGATTAHPFDRLGVVWFSTIVTDSGLIDRGPTTSGTNWDPLKPISSPTPDDETAMGDGVSRAIKLSQDSPADVKNDAVIVLVTDGIQTVGQKIKLGSQLSPPLGAPEDVMTYFFNLNLPPSGLYDALRKQCIPVQSIGVGVPGAPFLDLLNRISEETGGTMNVSIDGAGMSTLAMNQIIEALKGNTMTKIKEVNSSLASGTAAGPAVPFELSSSVKRAIVALNWVGTPSGGMELKFSRPGGGSVPIAQRFDGNGYTLQSVDLPAGGPPGSWSVTASRAGGNTATTPYQINVIAVEGRLSFRMDFTRNNYGTGEPVVLTAEFSDNGTAVTGLANSINVRVERPESGLGTILRQAIVDPSVLTTLPPGANPGELATAYSRKLFHLTKDGKLAAETQPKLDPRTFTLFDDGSAEHGDAHAGDGIYSMKLAEDDTEFPGLYRFKLAMDFDRPLLGKISRVETRELTVRVKVADPNETEIAATKALASGEYRIDVTPADRFKNFLGPGYADDIKLTLSGGGSVTGPPVDERENGTYTFRIVGVPSGADPTATLIVNGQTVKSGTLSSFSRPTKRFAFFGGIGSNFPHGDFNTIFDPGLSTQLGFEYRFTNRISAEGTFGYDRFSSPFFADTLHLYRGSANVKGYLIIGTFQFGVFGGGGVYHFTGGGGSETRGGLNIGAVSEFRINTTTSVEATYNFHNVFTSGSSTRFSTVQGGVRFRF